MENNDVPFDLIEKASEIIVKSGYVVVLTGSGISAESGIPTFRGKHGLWKRYRPEQLATPEGFAVNPKLVWEWYNWRINLVLNAEPNAGHIALSELEKMNIVKSIITQNVDDLHERAGSRNIIKLHGNILEARCIRCDYKMKIQKPFRDLPPKCPVCKNLLRPNVVWFNEPIPMDVLNRAYEEIERSDCLLVIGTSGVVMPAGAFPSIVKRNGGKVIEVNVDETHISWIADITLRGEAGKILPVIVEKVKKYLK